MTDKQPIEIDLTQVRKDLLRSFDLAFDLIFFKVPVLTILTLFTLAGYIGIFKPDIDPALPVFFRPLITIAFWSVSQTIWQAVSHWFKITFGAAFQISILVIVGVIISATQTNTFVIDYRVLVLWTLMLISAAMLDNLPRAFSTEQSPLSLNFKPKEKRKNIGLFDKSTRNNLEAETPGTIPYEAALDALIEEINHEHD
jgi:hypothetical protein